MHVFGKLNPRWVVLVATIVATLGMMACGVEKESAVAPAFEAHATHVAHRNAEPSEGGVGALVEPLLLAEYRQCDESTSEYTPNADKGTGKGEGNSIQFAQEYAVYDALKKDAFGQFICGACDTGRCDQYVAGYGLAAAVMTDPAGDCTYDEDRRKWVCDGEVDFQKGKGPLDPYIRAGCKKCP